MVCRANLRCAPPRLVFGGLPTRSYMPSFWHRHAMRSRSGERGIDNNRQAEACPTRLMLGDKTHATAIAPFEWRPFLQQVSRDLLTDDAIRGMVPQEVVESGWLGYVGAREEEIAALEKRLGAALPPSYRSFLAETNGWRNCGPFIYNLWPCSDVRWFQERNQDWIDAYMHPESSGITIVSPPGQEPPKLRPLTDEEYLTYGEEQDSCRFHTEYLQTALEISDVGDSAVLLLNPKTISDGGEWEAWLFANWMPGAHRYRSFHELMQGEYESFLRLRAGDA